VSLALVRRGRVVRGLRVADLESDVPRNKKVAELVREREALAASRLALVDDYEWPRGAEAHHYGVTSRRDRVQLDVRVTVDYRLDIDRGSQI
jgi:hypothetical protein